MFKLCPWGSLLLNPLWPLTFSSGERPRALWALLFIVARFSWGHYRCINAVGVVIMCRVRYTYTHFVLRPSIKKRKHDKWQSGIWRNVIMLWTSVTFPRHITGSTNYKSCYMITRGIPRKLRSSGGKTVRSKCIHRRTCSSSVNIVILKLKNRIKAYIQFKYLQFDIFVIVCIITT